MELEKSCELQLSPVFEYSKLERVDKLLVIIHVND